MSNFLTASIGRKFLMSITGLFLMMFILVHLSINLLLIFDDSGELFNLGANFMATNPAIKIVEPILGLGFIVHILWSFLISYQNYKARPVGYAKSNASYSSTWASRNMLILGALVLVFLVIHIIQFFIPVKTGGLEEVIVDGEEMHNTYLMVSSLFKTSVVFCFFYVLGGILLGLHLTHGFWSAFQTIGISNKIWLTRLQLIAKIFAIVVAVGFAVIPLYFLIKF